MSSLIIRHARRQDCAQLLPLMEKLAVFEGYRDDFTVTVDDLFHHGFADEFEDKEPNFTAIVAENIAHEETHLDALGAYLVYYLVPFTYDLRPTLFIKELYVDETIRGQGVGKQLMQQAIQDAKEKGCGRLKWEVLSDNIRAQLFYQSLGAFYDERWQGFVLNL